MMTREQTDRVSVSDRRVGQVAVVALAAAVFVANAWAQVTPQPPAGELTVPQLTPQNQAPATQPSGPSGKYRCDQPTFDGGEVWSGDVCKASFTITNDSETPLYIPTVKPSCGCTNVEWDKVIAPGKTGTIKADVKTQGFQPAPIHKTLALTTSDPSSPNPILNIKATIKARLLVQPPNVAFGKVDGKSAALTQKVTITNNRDGAIKLEKMPMLPNLPFTAELTAIEEGKKYELTVTAEPARMREGQNFGQVMLRTGVAGDTDVPIQITATRPPLIDVGMAVIPLQVPTDAAVTRDIMVTYNGDGTMKIVGEPTSSDPAIKATIVEAPPAPTPANPKPAIEPGKSFKLTVVIPAGYDPPFPLPANAQPLITVKTDVAQKPEFQVRVQTYPKRPTGPRVNPDMLVGKPAPQHTVKDAAGKSFVVGETGGRLNVVTFWASWCPHCKKLLPTLQKMSDAYASKGVDFKLVSLDQSVTVEQVGKIAEGLGVKLPMGFDPKQESGHKFGASSFPMTFVLNKNGTIEAVDKGSGIEGTLKEQIDMLLEGKPLPRPVAVAPNTATRPAVDPVPPNVPTPMLIVGGTEQDVGKHKPGSTGRFNLFLRNGGSQPLNIVNVKPSEGLKLAADYPKSLEAGASGGIGLEFNTPSAPGAFEHQVTLATNDPTKPEVTIKLKGTARALLEVEPVAGVDFGRKPAIFSMQRMATITYNGEGAVNFLSAESSSPQFEAVIKPIQQGPNVMVLVSAKGPFSQGEHKATITVKSDSKDQPTIQIPVALFQPPRIDIAPAEVLVNRIPRLQQSLVTITNNGSSSISMLGVKASSDKIRWQFFPEPDGISYKLRVTLPADFAAGPEGEKVTIRTDDSEYGEIVVPIKIDEQGQGAKSVTRVP